MSYGKSFYSHFEYLILNIVVPVVLMKQSISLFYSSESRNLNFVILSLILVFDVLALFFKEQKENITQKDVYNYDQMKIIFQLYTYSFGTLSILNFLSTPINEASLISLTISVLLLAKYQTLQRIKR